MRNIQITDVSYYISSTRKRIVR